MQTSQTLKTIKYQEMPAFGVVENLVEEEVPLLALALALVRPDLGSNPSRFLNFFQMQCFSQME